MTERADRLNVMVSIAVWSIAVLGLSWFAVFRHSNLARWGVLVVFLLRASTSLFIAVAYHRVGNYLDDLKQVNWPDLLNYIGLMLEIIVVGCLFSNSTASWFKMHESKR